MYVSLLLYNINIININNIIRFIMTLQYIVSNILNNYYV